jgi:hypothetical protein
MMLKAILLLTNLVFFKASEVIDRKAMRPHIVVQKQEAGDYVILPLSKMWGDDFRGYSAGNLTPNDFAVIEGQLGLFAEEYNKEERKRQQEWIKRVPSLRYQKIQHFIKLKNYKRQYICGINRSGDKEVWVNCFCKSDFQLLKYWRSQTVVVMDGGECFFNLKINLTKKIRYDIMVNGIA